MAKSDFRFHQVFRVRNAEVDSQAIVFFGNYLVYFDTAHTEYLRAQSLNYLDYVERHGADMHTVRFETDYHAPARFDDLIEVYVRTAYIGRSSMRVLFEVYRSGEDELITTAQGVFVNADSTTMKSTPFPDDLVQIITEWEVTPVERP